MQFQDLKLIDPLLRAVRAEGYDTPTPIQVQAERGRTDLPIFRA